MKTKREEAFYAFYAAVGNALDTVSESHKEAVEDTLAAYLESLEAEGVEEKIPPEDSWYFFTETWPMSKREEAALTAVGKAIRDSIQAEGSSEAEAKLSEAVTENEKALKRSGLSIFVPKGKGFKEIE